MEKINLQKAMKLVENNDTFYYKDEVINGKKFRIFNYRLGSYSDFLPDGALEMRGLCIELESRKVFWGLHKFFNDGENPFTMDEELDNPWNENEVYEVMEKLDGSLILPTLIDGKCIFRTKGTFTSGQAKFVNETFQKEAEFSAKLMKMGLYPIFEFTSPWNQIVVPYEESKLTLIQIRDLAGNYLSYEELEQFKNEINVVKKYHYTLKELRKMQENVTDIEGWIVKNPNHPLPTQFRKFKTKWYFNLHHLTSPDALVENKIIEAIMDETIDDILGNLKGEKHEKVAFIRQLVSRYFNDLFKEYSGYLQEKLSMTRKDFAIKHKNKEYFGALMKANDEEELEKALKVAITNKTKKLTEAQKFIKTLKENKG